MIVRLGAVSYLNTAPLVYGLESRRDLFDLRFDVPAQCAALLHAGEVDLGLIPAIEYVRGDYAIVPGVAIGSDGPIASVAIFSRVPIAAVRTLALDTSSRTSVALTRVLCARHWRISPTFVPVEPDLSSMLASADAALVIGDPALEIDPVTAGVRKIDLGTEWRTLTGLPFVYAMWCGRAGAVRREHVEALNAARDRGVASEEEIARAYGQGDAARETRAREYLRDNLKYSLGPREIAGLERFHAMAAELAIVDEVKELSFYP
jgi:chorismate dehydratase